MNIFKKIKDYDRVELALEQERQLSNSLRVNLNVHTDSENRLREENKRLRGQLAETVTLSADKPEKRKYYTLALQKQLLPFIWEEDGKIFINVCKTPGK